MSRLRVMIVACSQNRTGSRVCFRPIADLHDSVERCAAASPVRPFAAAAKSGMDEFTMCRQSCNWICMLRISAFLGPLYYRSITQVRIQHRGLFLSGRFLRIASGFCVTVRHEHRQSAYPQKRRVPTRDQAVDLG